MNNKISTITAVLTNLRSENSPTVTIQCNNGEIMVKKLVLIATSEVFRAMFDSAMLENETNFVAANDVDFTTKKAITDYYEEGRIYKGEIEK
jgi:hypothetical protein